MSWFQIEMTDIQTNQGHRQTDRLTIIRVSSVKVDRTRSGKCTNTQTMWDTVAIGRIADLDTCNI